MRPNETLDRMTRSAVRRVFQCQRPWRAPHHRSALRSATCRADESAKEIDALDCKTNPEHFERLFSHLIARCATRMGITPQQLYERVAEAELRAVV
jgi:hypothetical protein